MRGERLLLLRAYGPQGESISDHVHADKSATSPDQVSLVGVMPSLRDDTSSKTTADRGTFALNAGIARVLIVLFNATVLGGILLQAAPTLITGIVLASLYLLMRIIIAIITKVAER